jgi:hypothetical protein
MAEYTRRVRQDGMVEITKSDDKVSFVCCVLDPSKPNQIEHAMQDWEQMMANVQNKLCGRPVK